MDKMREEFEKWAKDHEFCTYKIGDDYKYMSTQHAWVVWQASRSSLCVELPDNLDGEYYADGWNACLMATADKLEEQGVSSK